MWGTTSKTLRSCAVQVWMNAHGRLEEFGRKDALEFVKRQRFLREGELREIIDTLGLERAEPVATVFTLLDEVA